MNQAKPYLGVIAATFVLLSIPLIAMQFTNEVNWTGSDFVIMGLMLLVTGSIAVTIYNRAKPRRRWLLIGAVLALFVYVWAELAVGIFTNWGS